MKRKDDDALLLHKIICQSSDLFLNPFLFHATNLHYLVFFTKVQRKKVCSDKFQHLMNIFVTFCR